MTITINNGNKGTAKIAMPNSLATKINEEYPEMAMMLAMEELSELSQAISKCVRNGSKDKKDNLAEEIVDVLSVIQWAINRFDIPLQDIQKWAEEKHNRTIERDKTDEIIFRSNEAKDAYDENRIAPNSLCIRRIGKGGQYMLNGDIDNLAEYYHVLLTSLREKSKDYPDLLEEDDMSQEEFEELMDMANCATDEKIREEAYAKISKYDINNKYNLEAKPKKKKLTKKQEKKNSKDLDKILEKVSKKVKKDKKDDKKDSKKGKKGKK